MTVKEAIRKSKKRLGQQTQASFTELRINVDNKILAAAKDKAFVEEGKTVEILVNQWLSAYIQQKPEYLEQPVDDSVIYRGF